MKIKILERETSEFGTEPIYVKMRCKECGHTFGISISENSLERKECLCTNCLKEKYWNDGKHIKFVG